ncbi:WecB/TagA/CpsF family glycosyltransferase [Magnetococcales bacterium HHB-1]
MVEKQSILSHKIMREPLHFLDAPMHPWTKEETIEVILDHLNRGVFTQHCVVNVAKIVNMRRDKILRESVISCDIINIDGMGVVFGGRFLNLDIPERVAGIDLFSRLIQMAETHKKSVYLLGARQEVVSETVKRLQQKHPNLYIAGYHHGYFWDDEEKMVEKIRQSGAVMLFVAITSPKKERFIAQWKEQLGVHFVMGVGGTFDVIAGKTKRAPQWMQRYGLEWFYRIVQEPKRMWRRYLYTNTRFLWLLIQAKVKQLIHRR